MATQVITANRMCYARSDRHVSLMRLGVPSQLYATRRSSFLRASRIAVIREATGRTRTCRSAAVDAAEAEADLMELELKVEGMVCDGCSSRVTDALKAMDGVDKVEVNLSTGIATVELHASDPMDAAFNKMPNLVKKVGELGFKAQAHFEDW